MVKDGISKLGAALTPPGMSPELVWRLAVSGTLFALVVVVSFHIAWACGLVGESGFAQAADVDDTKRLILEEKLDRIYTVICLEQAVDQAIAERARSLQAQYREVNGGDAYPVDCELLRKIRAAQRAPSEDDEPSA